MLFFIKLAGALRVREGLNVNSSFCELIEVIYAVDLIRIKPWTNITFTVQTPSASFVIFKKRQHVNPWFKFHESKALSGTIKDSFNPLSIERYFPTGASLEGSL